LAVALRQLPDLDRLGGSAHRRASGALLTSET
jgi:hypothetical protein